MKTFIWRDFVGGCEDRGVLCVNAPNLEAAKKTFWAKYESQFELWWDWMVRNKHAGRRRKDVAWREWHKAASYVFDTDPVELEGSGVYYSGDTADSSYTYD